MTDQKIRERIDELKQHHELRIAQIMSILNQKPDLSAFEVASKMTWDIEADSWDDFPVAQKWFATGEAISHLRYLENNKLICRTSEKPVVLFGTY